MIGRTGIVLTIGCALLAARPAVAGETFVCPALAEAVQVGTCPSEEELRYGFVGYCSDNRRAYDKDAVTCTDFDHYRRLKNVALWEAGGGAFQGYLSCEARPANPAGPPKLSVEKAGPITKVVCTYSQGATLVHRTRARCTVAADGASASCE